MKYLIFGLSIIAFTLGSCSQDQFELDQELIEEYIADNNLTAEKDPSGVYVIITEEGTGDEHPDINSTVEVRYTGYLLDGSIFDSSGEETIVFALSGLITGWQIGIPYLKKGGKQTLLIPSSLGYGGNAVGSIPANSVLIFDIELVDFN